MLQFAVTNVRTIFITHVDHDPGHTFVFKTDVGLGLHCLKTEVHSHNVSNTSIIH